MPTNEEKRDESKPDLDFSNDQIEKSVQTIQVGGEYDPRPHEDAARRRIA
jgi:hypothetical protein